MRKCRVQITGPKRSGEAGGKEALTIGLYRHAGCVGRAGRAWLVLKALEGVWTASHGQRVERRLKHHGLPLHGKCLPLQEHSTA